MNKLEVTTPGYTCPKCGFQLFHPIARLSISTLGLYDDARFPGRCLLVLNEHQEDLTELRLELAEHFLRDMRSASRAIKHAAQADRINYAILGNAEPHLHCHLIPRRQEADPVPKRAPWAHPDPVTSLPPNQIRELITSIKLELERDRNRSHRKQTQRT